MNNPQQAKAMKKVAKLKSLIRCRGCGTLGYVYESYNPEWTGWTRWCYMCGRKDAEIAAEGVPKVEKDREFKDFWRGLSKEEKVELGRRATEG